MSSLTDKTTSTAILNAGQSSWIYITKGTTIVANQGIVILKTHLHQTDTLIPLAIRVVENHSSKIEFSQLYEVSAFANARIKLIAPTNLKTQLYDSKRLLSIAWRRLKKCSKLDAQKREIL
ncbi:MAG: hypothetical protein ACOYBT_01005 [Polynucleobacter sp.]